jgi:hypothetical protein
MQNMQMGKNEGKAHQVRERKRDYLCNNRRFGSGNVSIIAERIAFSRASFRSISYSIKSRATLTRKYTCQT